MARLWNSSLWNTFRWGQSAAFTAAMDALRGSHPVIRIRWLLDAGTQDITQYFVGLSSVTQEKERAPDKVTAGDATLVFNNASGIFTETSSSSFLYQVKYHNRNITIEVGFLLDDGSTEYVKVATMKVRSVTFSSNNSRVTIRVYDLVARLIGEMINARPSTMNPVAGGSNIGDGSCSDIDTKPFKTVAENWTLTCTLGGADSTATFSVVGSVSGNVGTATSGTEFSTGTGAGGIKFTIRGGDTNWAIDDTFTFSTVQMMEWTATNPVKIIWSILTGTVYDTGANEAWLTRTPQLSGTQAASNADVDWMGFQAAVGNVDFTVTGFIPWDYNLTQALEELLLLFLGSGNIDGSGRVFVKVYKPQFTESRNFADTKKVTNLQYTRDVREMINRVRIRYRKQAVWPFSDEDELLGLDGLYVAENSTSKSDYGQWFAKNFDVRWHNADGDHASFIGDRIIDKYGRPPARFAVETGLDGLLTEIGDVVTVTDEKSGYTDLVLEVVKKEGDYDAEPKKVRFELEDTGTTGANWAFAGSSADEGDGLSPQAADFDSASQTDKQFAYASQTGGSGSAAGPDYVCF